VLAWGPELFRDEGTLLRALLVVLLVVLLAAAMALLTLPLPSPEGAL
jgi:hypothetical protein